MSPDFDPSRREAPATLSRAARSVAVPVSVIGAGIAGTWQALLFAKAGHPVTLYERSGSDLEHSASVRAGGMLAPWCEQESAEPIITRLGVRALALWRDHVEDADFNGSLVIAHVRDRADFEHFARLTNHHERIHDNRIGELEPALAGRFQRCPVLSARRSCRAAPCAAGVA